MYFSTAGQEQNFELLFKERNSGPQGCGRKDSFKKIIKAKSLLKTLMSIDASCYLYSY